MEGLNRFRRQADGRAGAAYQVRMAVADSLAGMFRSFKVLQPVTKYRLKVGRIQVDGDYAVLRDNLGQDPTILQLRADNLIRVPGSSGNWPQNLIS
jgi:hypothetical protein